MIKNGDILNNYNKYMNPRVGNIPVQQPVTKDRSRVGNGASDVQGSFGEILQESIEKANNESRLKVDHTGKTEAAREVKFSKHALMRLQNRRIDLSNDQMKKISEAVDKAEVKGVKDSLVLMDKLAMVVNVKSRTVITAVSSEEMKENVFTNIDGAVIV